MGFEEFNLRLDISVSNFVTANVHPTVKIEGDRVLAISPMKKHRSTIKSK